MATVDARYTVQSLESWDPLRSNALVGSWKLVSCTAYRRSGKVTQLYGQEPDGRLTYEASGSMSVQVTSTSRPILRAGKRLAAPDELRLAFQGYEAYFASYAVDWETGIIHHHVQGSLNPNWIGTDQRRYFEFAGPNRLILSTDPPNSTPAHHTIVTLVWERLV